MHFSHVNGNSPARTPDKQWAHVFQAHDTVVELRKIPVPHPADDEILVQLEYSGVCHTDFHAWKGHFPVTSKQNLVGGHEGVGYVAALGCGVGDIKIGDKVGIQWMNRTCGECEFCSGSNEPLCPGLQLTGYNVDGTFQQYAICKAQNAVHIPPGIQLEVAAPILCAGVTVYKALRESNMSPGQVIAIVGAGGGLGSLACQYGKACGYRVLAVSTGAVKKRMCEEELGADYFVDYKSPKMADEIKQITGGGPHAAMIVAAAEGPFHQALEYIRPGGTIVAVGLPPGKVSADIFSMVINKVCIKGSYVGNRRETEEALEIAVRAGFSVQSRVVEFSRLPNIYESMEKGEMRGRVVLKIGNDPLNNSDHHAETNDLLDGRTDQSNGRLLTRSHLRAIEKAGRDFRSDTVTVPTEKMMQAIINASFGDNICDEGGDASVKALQEKVAQLTGKPAALFVPSGTMGNQICLRTHLQQPPHTVLLDYRAHVQCWETGALPVLSQASVTGVHPKNGIHLTLEDVKEHLIGDDKVYFPPTRIVSLENSLGGTILPLKHAREISNFVWNYPTAPGRPRIAMHLDGARVLEAVTAEGVDIKDYCAAFDSVSLCISKGLGAPMGSVIVGSREFIDLAVWFQKMFGGATRQIGMMAAAASVALETTLPLLPEVHARTRKMAEYLDALGYEFALPVETNMILIDLKKMGIAPSLFESHCKQRGLNVFATGRLVFHPQISTDGISRLREAMLDLITSVRRPGSKNGGRLWDSSFV